MCSIKGSIMCSIMCSIKGPKLIKPLLDQSMVFITRKNSIHIIFSIASMFIAL